MDLPIELSIHLCLFIDQGSHRSIYLSIDASISLSMYSSIYLFIVLSIYLSIDVLIYRSIVDVLVPLRPCRGIETRNVYVPHMRALARGARRSTCMQDGSRARAARVKLLYI